MKWSFGRCWTLRLNLSGFSVPRANVFTLTASCSITSALLLMSGGKHPGIVFRPGRLFILMTRNVRRALIPIMLAPVAPLSSWSCVCAKGTEVIVGYWLATIRYATTRDRSCDGMRPAPMLVEYFIDRYARKAGKHITTVEKRTLQVLQSYP